MKKFIQRIKMQNKEYRQYKNDLRTATGKNQIRIFMFITTLFFMYTIMLTYTAIREAMPISNGIKIMMLMEIYYVTSSTLMMILLKYKKKLIFPLAYVNIIVGLLTVLIGPFFEGFRLTVPQLIAILVLPAFSVFAPNIIYSIIFFIIIIIDVGIEINVHDSANIFPYITYYFFESMCLWLIVVFVNRMVFKNKIIELERMYELSRAADMDELTGLWNKNAILSKVSSFEKVSGKYAMMVVDIDNFKVVNDNYGHLKGDEVLKNTAKALKKTFYDGEYIARFGGDEFLVFMPFVNIKEIEKKEKEIVFNFKKVNSEFKEINISVGSSVLQNNRTADFFNLLFEKADQKMYEDKANKANKANKKMY